MLWAAFSGVLAAVVGLPLVCLLLLVGWKLTGPVGFFLTLVFAVVSWIARPR